MLGLALLLVGVCGLVTSRHGFAPSRYLAFKLSMTGKVPLRGLAADLYDGQKDEDAGHDQAQANPVSDRPDKAKA
ncbi:hypothetical protein N185_36765 [Sinorhizobium sp. GW3]|nr:hypothetical protein N185_36765 [Sinorhizobium sp. GW3]